MHMRSALLAAIAVAAGCGSASASMDPLSDSDLVSRASAVFAVKDAPPDRILGVHKGGRVVVDVRCGDVCPANTVRVVHYDIPTGPACTQIGGDSAMVAVPAGIGMVQQNFCIPHVLYQRKLYVDHPYQK